ncbi:uncharacterized protein MAM_06633 [Metarhizium album ARSEF 1941]|uniref:Uncharacterized protein n=1 Tax=Metarhizium album (strain ARSEF 1941) TaxID=1081103 RepID=A0A0B2WHS0_METAS|nr:uncharacterized protein MAM_06633 [Metarhizium album ARSEF 1941]KHN95576.1 hypothetical protein MAM_06633 [Metarhizium album ARSEF 1941]
MRFTLPLVATLAIAAPAGVFKPDGLLKVSNDGQDSSYDATKRGHFVADPLLQVSDHDAASSYERSNFKADPLLQVSDNPNDSSYN